MSELISFKQKLHIKSHLYEHAAGPRFNVSL